jgi:hypothetical protein
MSRFRAVALTILLLGPAAMTGGAQRQSPEPPAAKGQLTIDTIMRGPDLVGWPPSALRWSADSQQLYFSWRKPGEKEESTYVVDRDGGEPRKLSDDEVKNAPPAGGRWDKARRRVLAVAGGDVIIHDGASGKRIFVTRTTGSESNARWARNDTHVTFVRDGNLFIVAVEPGSGSLMTQLTDVTPKKTEPRLTDSQKFIREEEEKFQDSVRVAQWLIELRKENGELAVLSTN